VYIFYIVVTITLNVVLEIVDGSRGGWIIFSIGLFTLLSIPSGVLISIRSLYTEMLEERDDRKEERKAAKQPRPRWNNAPSLQHNSDTDGVSLEEQPDGANFRKR
jgi:hypothetical protein